MKTEKTFAGAYTVRVGDINYGGHMGDDIEVMHGSTKLVVFDYEKRSIAKVPDGFIRIMDSLCQ
jgi:hypothetical protein